MAELVPGGSDRRRAYLALGLTLAYLGAMILLGLGFGVNIASTNPSQFWPALGVYLAFITAFSLFVLYVPRSASLSFFDEGLVARVSRIQPGVSAHWEAIALRGRKVYIYYRPWGPPLVVSLTERQRERLAEWMKIRSPGPNPEGPSHPESRLRFAALH